jgi:phosphoribosylformylglycinamidine synthase subunit PurQ / glutaminase
MNKNSSVKVCVLRSAGTNCNEETGNAFGYFGAKVEQVHINRLVKREVSLQDYHILALSGGFSYGDDLGSGRILANELRIHLADDIRKFIADGKLIIGICNGFQILVKTGFLPGPLAQDGDHQDTTLTLNDSAKFEARWISLKTGGKGPWTKGLKDIIHLPVAHGEGKFVTRDNQILNRLQSNRQVAFTYCDKTGNPGDYPVNPNGSTEHIAGITDETGQILGLMPHPERFFFFTQCPSWTRQERSGDYGDGAKIFENGVRYVREQLL